MRTTKILSVTLVMTIVLSVYSLINGMSNTIITKAEEETINGIPENKYTSMVNDAIYLTNEYRQSKGLQPLKTSNILNDMATQRAKEQEITGMSHTRPDGSSCFTIYDNYGIDWNALAENSAVGQTTPESVVDSWKNSTYHNENMLSDFEYISIGITYYDGNYYWIQMFCSTSDIKVTNNAYIPNKLNNNSSQIITNNPDTSTEKMLQKGDINEDGKIDIIDLILLKKYILSLIDKL